MDKNKKQNITISIACDVGCDISIHIKPEEEAFDDRVSSGLCGNCGVPVQWNPERGGFLDDTGGVTCSDGVPHQGS